MLTVEINSKYPIDFNRANNSPKAFDWKIKNLQYTREDFFGLIFKQ